MEDSFRQSQFESPLRYPGGKACIFSFITKLFYENNLIGTSYAEPYAGGAGLALKLLYNEYVNEIHINDFDRAIYCFWKVITTENLKFCDWVENVNVNVDTWHFYKNIQNEIANYSDLEIAKSTFFLNRTNMSGVIKGGIIGGVQQKGKYKIDVRFNKNDLLKRITRVNLFRDRIKVSNLDGVNFINNIVKRKADFFIYLDPPYVQKGADLYMNFYVREDHKKLAKFVSKIPNRWLVSYDNNEFIVKLYKRYRKINYQLSQAASNRIGDEILVFSDQLNFNESIKNLKEPIEI